MVKTPIHGTSYIFILAKQPANELRIENILATELALGLQNSETYTEWAKGVKELVIRLREQLEEYRHYGLHIIGYGAAAKGMTLINAGDLKLDAVVDDNPLKQNLWCPGTTITVVSSDYIRNIPDRQHAVFVPLAWNFYAEITQKIRAIRSNPGDLFLRYFPTIKTDSNED